MKIKVCARCKKEKEATNEFFGNKKSKHDGLQSWCKVCCKEYKNDPDRKVRSKTYDKQYQIDKAEYIRCGKLKSSVWDVERAKKLLFDIDAPRESENGYFEVKCKKCRKYFEPTIQAISDRIHVLSHLATMAESNFYCSDKCRMMCSEYGVQQDIGLVPNGYKELKSKARQGQQRSKNNILWRQYSDVGYTYCEVCGRKSDELELHHTEEVAKTLKSNLGSLEALNLIRDENGHLVTCKTCHLKISSRCRQ